MGQDDSTGKRKYFLAVQKNRALLITLFFGVCIGLVLAERLYLWAHADEGSAHALQGHTLQFLLLQRIFFVLTYA